MFLIMYNRVPKSKIENMVQHFTMLRKFSANVHCSTLWWKYGTTQYQRLVYYIAPYNENCENEVLRCTLHVLYGTAWYHTEKKSIVPWNTSVNIIPESPESYFHRKSFW